ncbi:MAG: lysophospholipid acyltransferase family protein [Deltaproteobacteria bacterium]|jgi:KDO2-lipid IV(A) lauroyltransferase|nr:lysophospholipid acyltransferase family protein [Deltaproteobacteria bacterium]
MLSNICYVVLMALTWPLARLPRKLGLALGAAAGGLYYRLSRRRRQIALDNIREAVKNGALEPDLDPEATARKSFQNLGRIAMEAFRLIHFGAEDFNGLCTISGSESFKAWQASHAPGEPGLIFVTAHMGNWELACQVMPRDLEFIVTSVGKRQSPAVRKLLFSLRARNGNSFVAVNGGAKVMYETLKGGGLIGTLFDQAHTVGPGGAWLDFMGRPAQTTLGPLKLAAKTGAKLVLLFSHREGLRHYFDLGPVMDPPPAKDQERLMAMALEFNRELARYIRLWPDQWMWGHRRWRTPPPDISSPSAS